jgi:hypothetical protein
MAWQLRPAFPNGAFVPDFEHGSGTGDCVYGDGRRPEKGARPDPAGEIEQCSPTWPGRVEFDVKRFV